MDWLQTVYFIAAGSGSANYYSVFNEGVLSGNGALHGLGNMPMPPYEAPLSYGHPDANFIPVPFHAIRRAPGPFFRADQIFHGRQAGRVRLRTGQAPETVLHPKRNGSDAHDLLVAELADSPLRGVVPDAACIMRPPPENARIKIYKIALTFAAGC